MSNLILIDRWTTPQDEPLPIPSLGDIVDLVTLEALEAAARMHPYILGMIGSLALIRLVLTGLKIATQAEEPWPALMQDVWLISVAIYLTHQGPALLSVLAHSASGLGGLITGRDPVDVDVIIQSGTIVFSQLLGALGFLEAVQLTISLPTVITAILLLVVMLMIAVMVAVAVIELYLGGLLVILFTWTLLWNPLRFLFTSGVAFVISGVMKILAYAVVLSILHEPLSNIQAIVDTHGISMSAVLSTLVLGVITAAIGLRAGAIGTGISRGMVQLTGREPLDSVRQGYGSSKSAAGSVVAGVNGAAAATQGYAKSRAGGGSRMSAVIQAGRMAMNSRKG